MDTNSDLGALSSLIVDYACDESDDAVSAEDDEGGGGTADEISALKLASDILDSVVAAAIPKRTDAFTAVQEPSADSTDDESSDDSGNEGGQLFMLCWLFCNLHWDNVFMNVIGC